MQPIRLLVHVFLFLWIFFIPSSLSFHYKESAGLVNGVFVDYRIPYVSASAVLMLLFSVFFLMARKKKIPVSIRKTFIVSLTITVLFQFFLALYQFQLQRSLFGYIPFGEPNLFSPQISKGTFGTFGIRKLAYGTTPHPNVLAGFSVLSFLILLSLTQNKTVRAVLFLVTCLLCAVTQSLSATVALLVGLTVWLLRSRTRWIQLIKLGVVVVPFLSIIWFLHPTIRSSSNESFFRRSRLQEIAVAMLRTSPVIGIGWNNFTRDMENYGDVPGSVRFLQPVHHGFLLLIVETGILGWITMGMWLYIVAKANAHRLLFLAPLTVIASVDHYLVTLTTGRMILLISLLLLFRGWQHRQPQNRV